MTFATLNVVDKEWKPLYQVDINRSAISCIVPRVKDDQIVDYYVWLMNGILLLVNENGRRQLILGDRSYQGSIKLIATPYELNAGKLGSMLADLDGETPENFIIGGWNFIGTE